MNNYTLYVHVNKTNGKRYVGITSQKPTYRWCGGAGYKAQSRFYNAIRHYGWDGFDHVILAEGLSKEEAQRLEQETIREYRSNEERYGYNKDNGGTINRMSEETKAHLREINLGRHHTEEEKAKMSAALMGKSRQWLTGRKQTPETIKKRADAQRGAKNHNAAAVCQYDLSGNFIARYGSVRDAGNAIGITTGTNHISDVCIGRRKTAYGYRWKYDKE